jgi:hypothetical protein
MFGAKSLSRTRVAITSIGSMKGEFDNNDPIGLYAGEGDAPFLSFAPAQLVMPCGFARPEI